MMKLSTKETICHYFRPKAFHSSWTLSRVTTTKISKNFIMSYITKNVLKNAKNAKNAKTLMER